MQLMQVAPSCGQFFNSCKWCHLVAKFGTNASDAIWWPIFQLIQLMQVAPSCGQFFNPCKWCHLVAKFGTNASGATISWRDNSSLDALPWVRCASGNVFLNDASPKRFNLILKCYVFADILCRRSRTRSLQGSLQQRIEFVEAHVV